MFALSPHHRTTKIDHAQALFEVRTATLVGALGLGPARRSAPTSAQWSAGPTSNRFKTSAAAATK